jgi:flagellar biosynthetic protein FliR
MLEYMVMVSRHLVVYMPAVARIMAMLAVAPGFSLQQVPAHVRVLLGFSLALVMAPLGAAKVSHLPADPEDFVLMLVSEAVFGIVIGLIAALLIEAARYAGSFVELQAGLRVAEVFDPAQALPSSLLGHLYHFAAVVLFFDLNGHHLVLAGLTRSFQTMLPGSIYFPLSLGKLATDLVSAGFLLGISLCLPVLGALLLTDLSFGLIGRMVPRFNVFFVSLPAKMAVTLAGLAISAPVLAHAMAKMLGELSRYLVLLCGH